MTSDEERLGRVITEKQMEKSESNWYNHTKKIARKLGVNLEIVKKITKEKWKKMVKEKILGEIEKEMEEKEKETKKMRHQIGQKFERKKYLREMGIKEANETLRRRTEMTDVGNNMGRNRRCLTCGKKETIEHLIECRNQHKEQEEEASLEWLKEVDDLKVIRKMNKWIEREIEERGKQEE